MKELLAAIYHLTLKMYEALKLDKMETFIPFLNNREDLMMKVDSLKGEQLHYEYSFEEKEWLKKILSIDRLMDPLLKGQIDQTHTLLLQHKKKQLVSKKYHPYIKQTSGAFIDSKK